MRGLRAVAAAAAGLTSWRLHKSSHAFSSMFGMWCSSPAERVFVDEIVVANFSFVRPFSREAVQMHSAGVASAGGIEEADACIS